MFCCEIVLLILEAWVLQKWAPVVCSHHCVATRNPVAYATKDVTKKAWHKNTVCMYGWFVGQNRRTRNKDHSGNRPKGGRISPTLHLDMLFWPFTSVYAHKRSRNPVNNFISG